MGAAPNADAPPGDAAIVGMVEGRERFVPTAIKGNCLDTVPKVGSIPRYTREPLQDDAWIMWQQSGHDMVLLEAAKSEEMETLCARVIDEASNGVKDSTDGDCGRRGDQGKRKRRGEGGGKSDAARPQSSPLALTPIRKSGRKEKGEGEREAEDALENNTDFVPIGASSSGESTRSDTDAPDRITEVNQHSSGGSHRNDRTSPFTGGTSVMQERWRPTAAEEDTSSESIDKRVEIDLVRVQMPSLRALHRKGAFYPSPC